MLIRCGLLLFFLSCVRTTENVNENGVAESIYDRRFSYSLWPSVHNGAKIMRLRKRQIQEQNVANDGADGKSSTKPVGQPVSSPATTSPILIQNNQTHASNQNNTLVQDHVKVPVSVTNVTTSLNNSATNTSVSGEVKKENETINLGKSPTPPMDNPGVMMRGLIVFGGFAVMAIAYFIFYRKTNNKNASSGNTYTSNDANQFRYGVLQTDDRRDNMELSRVPLTMESDEDEDEDLEIFDLEQKKKSLSYVDLEVRDEDIVLNSPTESSRANDRDNLLLDIEDASQDTLINWSNNGNKSIL